MSGYSILNYLNLISLSLAVIFGGVCFKKSNPPTKVFTVTFFIVYIIQVVSFFLARFSISNLLLFHVYFAAQLIGYGLFYWMILPSSTARKGFLVFLVICLGLIVWEYSSKWDNLAQVFGGYSYFVMNLGFVFTSIYYLVHGVLQDREIFHKLLNYGMIVYAGGSSIVFLLGDKLNQLDWKPLLLINLLLFLVFQGFYFAQLWRVRSS
ncbi:hypothetical protein DN752_04745 [Echinicola strongylocentroti]|uniref:YhhN-like protein n=1 Tax=Echinicola strongylocentroti TaxID=1795355 RepID=A0A2Z4IFX1_9BACT|nr:hypothetical protein [Echinicola strongylocentroti]AWW29496.1 hypothetical protein DN752_04745 [Echinicola strongylocentroti]